MGRGGERIDGAGVLAVFLRVREHVDERAAHGARRRQGTTVPPIRDEAAATEEQAIDPPRQTHTEAAHALDQIAVLARFDYEVKMIGLHRVVRDLKPSASP